MPQDVGLAPIEKAVIHNVAVLAATDVLATALAPITGRTAVLFRILVMVSVAGVFSARITRATVTVGGDFNSGAALVANALHTFDLLIHTGDTINFRTSVGANMTLRVQEIYAGVQ